MTERSDPKVLVACYPASGHFHPIVPLARALRDTGAAVRVATAAEYHPTAREAGLDAVACGPSNAAVQEAFAPDVPELLARPPAERRAYAFSRLFGAHYAAMVADSLHAIVDTWQPDLVLAGLEFLAAPLVTALSGRPLAMHGFGVGLAPDVLDAAAAAVAPLWRARGLTPPADAGLDDGVYVDPCPASLRPTTVYRARRILPISPAGYDGGGEVPDLPARRPLVYITFGTMPLFARADALAPVIEALDALHVGAVVTGIDASSLGTLPDSVVTYPYIPQSAVLARCDAVVCHAGASTLFGALRHGLPLVLLPQGADQLANADAAVRRGVAVAPAAEPGAIAEAIASALVGPDMRAAATTVSQEIAAMPAPESVAASLVQSLAGWGR
jgi:UDP:flavonoid glycosyltransferase YjiC (YdhE family)